MSAAILGGTPRNVSCLIGIPLLLAALNAPMLSAAPHGKFRVPRGAHGKVSGGRQSIVGATVAIFEAGTTGYGSTPTMIDSQITGPDGRFDFGEPACSSPDAQIFLSATGGDAVGGGMPNPAIKMLASLGVCSAVPDFVNVNELTTVATVWAFSQFFDASNPDMIGAPTSNAIGLANAASVVAGLVDPATGVAGSIFSSPNPPAGGPDKINTLADVLVSCIDSAPPAFSACSSLFAAATPPVGAIPTNTLQAALSIAAHPARNVSDVFAQVGMVTEALPFLPILSTAPRTWLVGLAYQGVPIAYPEQIAVDATGNVFVTDLGQGGHITKFAPNGLVLNPTWTAGVNRPFGIVIDSTGNFFVSNIGDNTVVKLSASGAVLEGPVTGLTGPRGLAISPGIENVYVANLTGNTVSVLGGDLTPVSTFTGLNGPLDVAFATDGTAWVTNNRTGATPNTGTSIAKLGAGTTTSFTGGGLSGPRGIQVSAGGLVWVGNANSTSRISQFDSNGAATPGFPVTSGGRGAVSDIVLDSSGNLFALNVGGGLGSITVVTADGTPITPPGGWVYGSLVVPAGAAIDQSGNLWVASKGSPPSAPASVTQFLGIARPVKTPVVGPPLLP